MKNCFYIWMPILFILALVGCSGANSDQEEAGISFPVAKIPPQERSDFFIAVHCEPGKVPVSTEYVRSNWPALTQMVQSASQHNMHLTLLINPQWAMYILENPERKDLVHVWEANGHEIGLHHHGPHTDNWNGYTNQQAYTGSPKYLGTIDEMMVLLEMIPASGQIMTACVSSDDAEADFPPSIPYETTGGSNKTEDFGSTPTIVTRNGVDILQFSHARYAARGSNVNVDLEEMRQMLNMNENDEVMGIAFHPFEYAENPNPFNALFSLLDDNEIHTRTVAAIVENRQ